MATLLARNAEVLVTMDGKRRELKNAGVYAEDGIIKKVGPNEELPATADTVIDLSSGSTSYIEDCQVCCQPIEFTLEVAEDGTLANLETRRGD